MPIFSLALVGLRFMFALDACTCFHPILFLISASGNLPVNAFALICFQTYNVDFQVPDSAGTGTAYLSGVKTNMGVIGVTQEVRRGNCGDVTEDTLAPSILRWSIADGNCITFWHTPSVALLGSAANTNISDNC